MRTQRYSYSVIHSPDDDGWYVEIFEARSGRTVELEDDPLFESEREARFWAEDECHRLEAEADEAAWEAEADRRVDAYLEDGIHRPMPRRW